MTPYGHARNEALPSTSAPIAPPPVHPLFPSRGLPLSRVPPRSFYKKKQAKPYKFKSRAKKNPPPSTQPGERKREANQPRKNSSPTFKYSHTLHADNNSRSATIHRVEPTIPRPIATKAPKLNTYTSGWTHEAGGCAVPPQPPTCTTHSGRRARFRIPLSQ